MALFGETQIIEKTFHLGFVFVVFVFLQKTKKPQYKVRLVVTGSLS